MPTSSSTASRNKAFETRESGKVFRQPYEITNKSREKLKSRRQRSNEQTLCKFVQHCRDNIIIAY